MTRIRLSFMVSEELSKAADKIIEEEAFEAKKLARSPLPKSRTYEQLFALGITEFRRQLQQSTELRKDLHEAQ